jgi:hypothetical protein
VGLPGIGVQAAQRGLGNGRPVLDRGEELGERQPIARERRVAQLVGASRRGRRGRRG